VADATGTTVWRWDQQEPFGVNVPDENPSALGAFEFPLRFPGQYADKETNLHYNYFRDYDPGLGRYVQSDPIGLDGGLNLYVYVDSDPIGDVDPEGLQRAGRQRQPSGAGKAGSQRRLAPCWLYNILDCDGVVVYIGITNDPSRRQREHEARGKIKQYQCTACPFTFVEIRKFNTRAQCEAAEDLEIMRAMPIFNIRNNPLSNYWRQQQIKTWQAEKCC
jgi:RHS repeat-associated protein